MTRQRKDNLPKQRDMEYERKLALAIYNRFEQKGEAESAQDLIYLLKSMNDDWAHKQSEKLRTLIIKEIRIQQTNERLYKALRESLKFDATYSFDAYMRFLEWERDPEKRFYLPRRKILKPMCVDPIQDMLDGKIDILSLSMPPGTGKSTLGTMLLSYVMGKDPDKPSLASAHSGTLTESFYKSVLGIITDPEYTYKEIFPLEIAEKDGMKQTIDLVKPHKFASLTCRAINASLTGATRCERLLYADDLVSGIEEATNPDRLDSLWQKYTNDLKSRKKEGAAEVHIATRWSVRDVIGRLEAQYGDDPRCKFIRCPALDANEKSNFEYEYGVGFSTKYFIDMRANLDDVSWSALFMNEPYEREGLLFPKDELRYYYELPKNDDGTIKDPDYIISVADTKDKGKDYGVMPVGYVYGQDVYIEDAVCNNGKPEIVEAQFIEMLLKHKVKMCRFESNSAGGKIADKVAEEVKKRGGLTHITRKYTTANKETKIQVNSPMIRQNFLFKANFDRTTAYGVFMYFLTTYVLSGKNKHDDVPDALAMLVEYWESFRGAKAEVFQRPF